MFSYVYIIINIIHYNILYSYYDIYVCVIVPILFSYNNYMCSYRILHCSYTVFI